MNYVTETFLSGLVASTHVKTYCILSGFVHGQGQKSEHKDITKNFAGLHSHFDRSIDYGYGRVSSKLST